MARAIRLAAPPLAVLLVGGVVVGVLLSSGKSSPRHAHAGSPPGGATGQQAAGTQAGGGATDVAHAGGPANGRRGTSASSGSTGGGSSTGGTSTAGAGSKDGGTTTKGHDGVGSPAANAGAAPNGTAGNSKPSASNSAASAPAVASDGALASTSTETGKWSTTSVLGPELEPNLTTATITFSVPLAHALPESGVVYVREAEAQKPGTQRILPIREACGERGTVQAPTAEPGHLCVYAGVEDLRDRDPSGGVPTHDVNGAQVPFVDAEYLAILNRNTTPGANRTGANVAFGVPLVRTPAEEAAHAYAHIVASGSWAVSAP